MAHAVNATRILFLSFLAVLAAAASGGQLRADSISGLTLGATGSASAYTDLAYPETTTGGVGSPDFKTWLQSDLLFSAESQSTLFRLRLEAYAEGDKPSNIIPTNFSDALSLEVREAEAALLPSASLALRGGILLRNFGVGSYGSPVNPFARDVIFLDQSGFWGLDAEWTPVSDLSTLAILSADRAAQKGTFSGLKDLDSGALIRFSPGVLDVAAGAYASGAANGEVRPILYVSVPILTLLSSLEAALSVPLSGSNQNYSESLRFELRKSVDIGQASFELGVAYRGIFPGRDENEIARLIAQTPPAELAYLPFAPFYGSNYVELSLYLEKTNAFSLQTAADLALPWGSVSVEAKGEVYIGDVAIFVRVQGFAGDANGEFNSIALATGFPGLEVWTGVELSF